MSKAWAFLKRDFIQAASYKLSFLTELFDIFLSTLTFYFLSRLFGKALVPFLQPYGGDYFSFVLIGIAFSDYLRVSLNVFAHHIRGSQMMGTLEALLVTQTSIPTLIFSSSLYHFLFTSSRVLLFLFLGAFFFDLQLIHPNLGAALLILLLTITAFSSLGILSASFIMVFKQGNPIAWFFEGVSWVLGGVYYPITVLPQFLQVFSSFLPITYSLRAMRQALLQGHSLQFLAPDILILFGFTVFVLPFSLYVFRLAVKKAKRDGSLTHY